MYSFDYTYRVRYADTDKMGYMYYGHYARLYEIGRVEALRSLGVRYKDLEDDGIIMPVLENYSKYFKPALYDELLTIRIILKTMPGTRSVFNYEIYNETEVKIHEGQTTLVFYSVETQKVIHCPDSITKALEPFYN